MIFILCSPLYSQTLLVDTLTTTDTISGPATFTTVNFSTYGATFTEAPLIFALTTSQGNNSSSLRLRNVTTTGFEIVVAESDSWDGPHIAMPDISFIAVTPGRHEIEPGVFLDASRRTISETTQSVPVFGSAGSTRAVEFREDYSAAPAVLAQIQTMNNETRNVPSQTSQPWMTASVQNITSNGFDLSLERSESNAGSITTTEQVGVLALQNTTGGSFTDDNGNAISWEAFITGQTIDGWDDSGANIAFNNTYSSAPLAVASKATRNGGDGGWLRRGSISSSQINLLVDEDTANDSERNHTTERASLAAFSEATLETVTTTLGSSQIVWQGPGSTNWNNIDSWDRWDGDDYNLIDGQDTLIFNNTGSSDTTATVDASYTTELGSITFQDTTAYTIDASGGGNLVITDAGNIINNSSATQTISVPIAARGSSIVLDSGTTPGGALVINAAGTIDLSDTSGVELQIQGDNDVTINSVISGAGGTLTKNGTGTTTLGGANSFTGNIVVNAGTLLLGTSNVIPNASDVTLAGGTLDTAGNSDVLSTLTLTSNSTINLGSGASIINFTNSSANAWTGGATLTIANWSGDVSGAGTDQIFFGNSAGGLTSGQLGQIQFVNPLGLPAGTYAATILSTGEIVPVPEAETWIALVSLILVGIRSCWKSHSFLLGKRLSTV